MAGSQQMPYLRSQLVSGNMKGMFLMQEEKKKDSIEVCGKLHGEIAIELRLKKKKVIPGRKNNTYTIREVGAYWKWLDVPCQRDVML